MYGEATRNDRLDATDGRELDRRKGLPYEKNIYRYRSRETHSENTVRKQQGYEKRLRASHGAYSLSPDLRKFQVSDDSSCEENENHEP